MQELQCADCIMNFLETERDSHVRDYIFELLFDDSFSITKHILQSLLSYSISLEAQNTLECISKWIIINIGNEIMQSIFNQLIRDHFLLSLDDNEYPPQNLVNLARIAPLFASLFITVILDMLPNNLINNHEKCLTKLFNLFDIWISRDPILAVLAYKTNISHTSAYLFNPLPGLMYVSVIHPVKVALICFQDHKNESQKPLSNKEKIASLKKIESCKQNAKILDDLSSKVHFISIKLIKDLESAGLNMNSSEAFKLLNIKHVESVNRVFEELNQAIYSNQSCSCFHSAKSLIALREDCLDRIAQLFEVCFRHGFISCRKQEVKQMFSGFQETRSAGNEDLLTMVLNSE